MRTLFLAASAILPLLAGGPAQAADLPAKAPMYKAPVAYSWTGLYIGGHLGAGWNTGEWPGSSSQAVIGSGKPFQGSDGAIFYCFHGQHATRLGPPIQ